MGARTIRVQWAHVGAVNFPFIMIPPPDGFIINITSTSEGSANTIQTIYLDDGNIRSYLVSGLQPYSYNDREGVTFDVTVTATCNSNQSIPVSSLQVTLPGKAL